MFSNDQNIETIGQLAEVLKHYVGLQGDFIRLSVTEKIVRLLTAIAIFFAITVLLLLVLIYLSFAAAYALEPIVGLPWAFTIISGTYLLLLLLCLLFRKRWIQKPLVRFLAGILIDK